ncbi:MAG: hypothetical protein AAGE52_28580 [Myxococcota bacterium]
MDWIASKLPEPVNFLLSSTLATDEALVHVGPEGVHPDALRSYAVHYLTSTTTPTEREDGSRYPGTFKSFVSQTRWDPLLRQAVREGLEALRAEPTLKAFRRGERVMRQFSNEWLEAYFLERGSGWQTIVGGINRELKKVRLPNEDLDLRNAEWLRHHSDLRMLSPGAYATEMKARRGSRGEWNRPWLGFYGI